MACFFMPRLNRLWSIWYGVFFVLIHAYLLYLGIKRYMIYTDLDDEPVSPTSLYVYISLHIVVIALITLFLASALFQVGNLASDGAQLGFGVHRRIIICSGPKCCKIFRSMWAHGPPVAETLHLICAFLLLMAHTIMETEMFKNRHGYLSKEEVWTLGDIDWLFSTPIDLHYPYKFGGSRMLSHQLSAIDVEPKFLPVIVSMKLYGISLLFTNFLVALVAFAITYSSVFYPLSKPFALVFSLQLFTYILESVFAFFAFKIMFRLLVADYIHDYLKPGVSYVLHNANWLLLDFLATGFLTYIASCVLYAYGYSRYCLSLYAETGRFRLKNGQKRVLCDGYLTNGIAIFVLLLLVGAKGPLFHDLLVLSQQLQEGPQLKLLCCIGFSVLYLFTWLLLWLLLTLKRDWRFKLRHSAKDVLSLLGIRPDPESTQDNTLVVVAGGEVFVSQDPDPARKRAVVSLVESGRLNGPISAEKDASDVYWLKPTTEQVNHVTAVAAPHPDEKEPNWKNKKGGYYKVSFDDPNPQQQDTTQTLISERLPEPALAQPKLHPQSSPGSLRSARQSGQYIRFMEQERHYDPDVVTTFGTLPRGPSSRQYSQQQQDVRAAMVPLHTHHRGSSASIQYASVQKPNGTGLNLRFMRGGSADPSIRQVEQQPLIMKAAPTVHSSAQQQPQPQHPMDSSQISTYDQNVGGQNQQISYTPVYYATGQQWPSREGSAAGSTAPRYASYASIATTSNPQRASYSSTSGTSDTLTLTRGSPKHSPVLEQRSNYSTLTDPYSRPPTGRTHMSSFTDVSRAGAAGGSRDSTPLGSTGGTPLEYPYQQQQAKSVGLYSSPSASSGYATYNGAYRLPVVSGGQVQVGRVDPFYNQDRIVPSAASLMAQQNGAALTNGNYLGNEGGSSSGVPSSLSLTPQGGAGGPNSPQKSIADSNSTNQDRADSANFSITSGESTAVENNPTGLKSDRGDPIYTGSIV